MTDLWNWRVRADASYVLDWLRQTKAPANVIELQRNVAELSGGYVSKERRQGPRAALGVEGEQEKPSRDPGAERDEAQHRVWDECE